ncbi:hypothetical protein [Levilactobacillus suantsaiihabitans]|uniref:Uncharacterized protein n=1 Tax=Levilactobacillus suantsaiihabitans TaxID=2487722 RepID=A0A4Z0JAA8_9LACO|nr:hypothetical protein [Levilactobacillus suantsaiihabitans]TGD19289.1 hypothetical protein EGT51_05300 [Levilactobacillus suantsaiihabitans]
MSENSRMARYHANEEPAPQQQSAPPATGYQRRPALARWVAFLILLLTVTVGLRVTVFNATYTAGVVSRSSFGEKIINRLNDDLQNLGVAGAPITSSIAQPYLAVGVAQLYGDTTSASVDTSELTTAVSSQAQAMGVTASSKLIASMATTAQKRAKAAFNTSAMSQAAVQVQRARKLNFWVMLAALMLMVVTFFYALSVRHVFASLGPGLALGGLLTGLVGLAGYFGLPLVLSGNSQAVNQLLTTIGRSGLGVVMFAGVAEVVVGLLVLLGHHTFRQEN